MPPYLPRTVPFQHQAAEHDDHWATEARAIFWEMGVGKSKVIVDRAGALFTAGRIDAVVTLAPPGVDRNWATDEIPSHMPEGLQEETLVHVWRTSSAGTKWHARAAESLVKHKGLAWLTMSYDAIMTTAGKTFLWKLLRHRRALFVADESHSIKSAGAKRTIRTIAAARYAPFRNILTGTPIAQGPFDVYSQVKFLDDEFWEREGFGGYTAFKNHFGIWFRRADCQELHGYDPGYDKLKGYRNLDQLQEILKKISTRLTKAEALDLPPKVYSRRYYELTPEQTRLYQALKEDFYAETMGGTLVEAPLAIVRLLRFQQICCGYVGTDDDEEPYELLPGKNPLLASVAEWAEGLGEKTIIWCRFTKDIELVADMLRAKGGEAVKYYGGQTGDENADASEQFKRGNAQWIIANPQKGATGLTWNMAHHVGYYSNSFRLLDRLQSEDRAHRIGTAHTVDYTDFVGQMVVGEKVLQTVTHHIVKNLRSKFDIATKITGDTLREWI